jgi:hypothetical protein
MMVQKKRGKEGDTGMSLTSKDCRLDHIPESHRKERIAPSPPEGKNCSKPRRLHVEKA